MKFSPHDLIFFSIFLVQDFSFWVKNIEIWVPATFSVWNKISKFEVQFWLKSKFLQSRNDFVFLCWFYFKIVPMRLFLYYVSTFLDFFWPTRSPCWVSMNSTERLNCHCQRIIFKNNNWQRLWIFSKYFWTGEKTGIYVITKCTVELLQRHCMQSIFSINFSVLAIQLISYQGERTWIMSDDFRQFLTPRPPTSDY